MEEKSFKEEERFEVKMLDQMTKLNQLVKALEERVNAVETTLDSVLVLGKYKKLHCAHNIGGVCRFCWHNEPSVGGGIETVELEAGKYHPKVTGGFCASCTFFMRAPLP